MPAPPSCVISLVVALVLGAACSPDQVPLPPSSPTPPSPPDTSLYTLSGVVFEQTTQGPIPVSGRVAYNYVRPGQSFGTGGDVVALQGQFVFEHVLSGTAIRLRGNASSVWRNQPCAADAVIRSNTVLDIELVADGARGVTAGSPTLTGVVYEMTAAGRKPIPTADVMLIAGCSGLGAPYMRTDAEGRYAFCRVPRGPVCVFAALERYGGPWFSERQVPMTINDDTVLDIELRPGTPSFSRLWTAPSPTIGRVAVVSAVNARYRRSLLGGRTFMARR
jgi:hypothetical protein